VKFNTKSDLTTTKQAVRIKLPSHICYSRTGLTGIATFARIVIQLHVKIMECKEYVAISQLNRYQ